MDDQETRARQGEAPTAAAADWGLSPEEISPVGVFRMDLRGECIAVNERWCALTGLTRAEGLGSGWLRAVPSEDRAAVRKIWADTTRAHRSIRMEQRIVRSDSLDEVWVIVEVHPVRDGDGRTRGYVGTLTDVSALKHTEEALRREKELRENIIGSSVDGILAFDRECRYTVWNPAMERISGVRARDALGRRAFDVFPFLEEIGEDWYFHEALAGRVAMAKDRRYAIPSTGHSGFFEGRYSPLRNPAGEVVGGLAIIRDITAVKDAEAKLLQAGRLAAMGQLGAGVAHELNQPLAGIQLLLDLIREEDHRSVAEVRGELDVIAEQVARMGRIVENIRGFARRSAFAPRPVPPIDPIRGALALMGEQLRLAGVQITEVFDRDLPLVQADEVQLQQVFLNLLSNALHALESHQGPRTLEMGARSRGDRVEIWLEDSGPGIPVADRGKLFEPFFTTKDPGRGMGLGLSLCYGIMQAHSGSIRFEAPDGGGARFTIDLPQAQAAASSAEAERTVERGRPGALVLVVDDEPLLRDVIGRSLTRLGHRFEAVADAESALARATENAFDLALVDLRMPKIDGHALCARLRERQPELELVVMSGFITEAERKSLADLGVGAVLAKPFDTAALGEVIAARLNRGPSQTPT